MALILAIDLGRYNSVFCEFNDSSGEVAFRTVKTTPDSLRHERHSPTTTDPPPSVPERDVPKGTSQPLSIGRDADEHRDRPE